jgi:hypothetical protein
VFTPVRQRFSNRPISTIFTPPLAFEVPYFNRTGSGGTVSFMQNKYFDSSTGWFPLADQGSPRSDAHIRTSLHQMRTVKPTYTTSLPAGVTDVRLHRINVRYGATGVHIKP